MLRTLAIYAALATAAGACDREVPPEIEITLQTLTETEAKRDLDLLFVIDNSGGSIAPQLGEDFQNFMDILAGVEGGLPSVHIGVVSSDVGAGPYGINGCTEAGDDGLLQSEPSGACDPPDGAFISDVADPACAAADPDACRVRNYTGTLGETFACIAALDVEGCGFEQHLEAMDRALDGRNAGFRRDDAALAIVILTEEDDCSVNDTGLFDPGDTNIDDPLGPLSSFRCFEFGVTCDGTEVSRGPASYEACEPREGTAVNHPRIYAARLKNRVPVNRLFVSAIVGPAEPVEVVLEETTMWPELAPSCTNARVEAAPAVRLASFLDEFPAARTRAVSICSDDFSDALTAVAGGLSDALTGICLDGAIHDTDGDAPGVQAECDVVELRAGADQLAPCDETGGARPCYELAVDPACVDTATGLSLRILRDEAPPPGTRVSASCLVEEVITPGTTRASPYECAHGGGGPGGIVIVLLAGGLAARRRHSRVNSPATGANRTSTRSRGARG